jgi:hypothetical protein
VYGHERPLEASLRAEYGVDLLDYWRRDEVGRPVLSMRRLAAYVAGLPSECALGQALGSGWRIGDYLLGDVLQVLTGERHPSDPRTSASDKAGRTPAASLAAHRARARVHRKRHGITGSVLRRGAEKADPTAKEVS